MTKHITLPEDVNALLQTLNNGGYEAYIVGGCVRDSILGRIPQDWDITTSALPEQTKALFPHTFDTGIQHGTITVVLNKTNYEITTGIMPTADIPTRFLSHPIWRKTCCVGISP